ncbi:excalibur calcium-binding domain-containing protein [Streptomyces sp. NPDC016562]|uniref:excalibur calcium-binding domain-containing protein n=1 Tax=Streptomyces sp. NPDC016562 TaxID=3364966 RepID=UPI0036FCBAD9
MFHRQGITVAAVMASFMLLGAGCGGSGGKPDAGKGSGTPGGGAVSAPAPATTAAAQLVMPALVGQRFTDAGASVKKLTSTPVEARSAYGDVPLAADHGAWAVCFQTPAAGAAVTATSAVEVSLVAPGTPCPEKAGAASRPSASPTAEPTPSSGGGAGVYYKNCDAAKAAGAAPIRRGQPGYRDALDRDKDGVACDK